MAKSSKMASSQPNTHLPSSMPTIQTSYSVKPKIAVGLNSQKTVSSCYSSNNLIASDVLGYDEQLLLKRLLVTIAKGEKSIER